MNLDSLLERVPDDVLYIVVLDYLRPAEIVRLCESAKTFNKRICGNPRVWKSLYKRDISDKSVENYEKSYKDAIRDLPLDQIDINTYAAYRGYEKIIYPVKLGKTVTDSINIVHNAAEGNQLELVKKYYTNRANKETILRSAIKNNNDEMFAFIFNKMGKEKKHCDNDIINYNAALYNNLGLLRKYNIPENIEAILLGAVEGNHKQLVEYAINNGATDYDNVLDAAVIFRSNDIVEIIASNVINNDVIWNSLRLAAQLGYVDILTKIKQAKNISDAELIDILGQDPGMYYPKLYIGNQATLNYLISLGGKYNLNEMTESAVINGNVSAVKFLLSKGGNLPSYVNTSTLRSKDRYDMVIYLLMNYPEHITDRDIYLLIKEGKLNLLKTPLKNVDDNFKMVLSSVISLLKQNHRPKLAKYIETHYL